MGKRAMASRVPWGHRRRAYSNCWTGQRLRDVQPVSASLSMRSKKFETDSVGLVSSVLFSVLAYGYEFRERADVLDKRIIELRLPFGAAASRSAAPAPLGTPAAPAALPSHPSLRTPETSRR